MKIVPLIIWIFIPKEKGKSSEPYFYFNYFCSCEIFAYVCLYFLQVGAADYIAVAKNYHTVFISDIPVMSMRIRDKVLLLHSCCHPTVICCMCVYQIFLCICTPISILLWYYSNNLLELLRHGDLSPSLMNCTIITAAFIVQQLLLLTIFFKEQMRDRFSIWKGDICLCR